MTKRLILALVLGAAVTACAPETDQNVASTGATSVDPVAYWDDNAKGGFLEKGDALGFQAKGGKPVVWSELDTDADGRVSQSEWTAYHSGAAGAAGPAAPPPATK